MPNEKKLKNYAEDRLSAYADGEDSLARLKRVQAAQKEQEPQAQKTSARVWIKRFAFTFSVVVVVVLAALLIRFVPGGSQDATVKNEMSSGANYAREGSFADEENGVALFTAAEVNEETLGFELVLPAGAAFKKIESSPSLVGDKAVDSEKAEEKDQHYYLYSVEEEDSAVGAVTLIVSFGGALPEWTSFVPESIGAVEGESFAYSITQEGLLGKIQTEKETLYVRFSRGENVQACLEWLGSILIKK